MISVKIYGMPEREDMIRATATKLNLSQSDIYYDDGSHRTPLENARFAWEAPIEAGVTHRCVLQDDVEVCDGFIEILERMAKANPKAIYGLFPFEYQRQMNELEKLESPYIECTQLSGCGVMMPVEYIPCMFDWLDTGKRYYRNDDDMYDIFAKEHNILVLTTIPATLQHIGDVSLYNYQHNQIRRTHYYTPNPIANWDSTKIYAPIVHKTESIEEIKFKLERSLRERFPDIAQEKLEAMIGRAVAPISQTQSDGVPYFYKI